MKYLIIIEPTANGFSAYSPDLDGCVAVGATHEETAALMREAVEFHLEGLLAAGEPIPAPFILEGLLAAGEPIPAPFIEPECVEVNL